MQEFDSKGVTALAPEKTPRRAYLVLSMLFLFQTLNFFDKVIFGISAPSLMKEYALTPAKYGLISSTFFLFFAVSGVIVGLWVVGRVAVKWLLLSMVLIWSLAQLPIYLFHSVTVLVLCRILLGIGQGPGLPVAVHTCFDWFPPVRRSMTNAIVIQGISAGLLLGSPLLTWVLIHYSWRAGFLTCAALGFAWCALWLFVGKEGPYCATHGTTVDVPAVASMKARDLWLDPSVIGIIIMSTMAYWIVGISPTWLPLHLQNGLGFSRSNAAWVMTAIYLFQSPLLLVGSWLSQRMRLEGWTDRTTLGIGSGVILLVSAIALQASNTATGTPQIMLLAVAFAAPSLTTIFGPIALGSLSPPQQRGRLIVVIYSANTISALFSNSVTGWIVGKAGPASRLGYEHAMSFTALTLLCGAIASFALIHPDRSRERYRNRSMSE